MKLVFQFYGIEFGTKDGEFLAQLKPENYTADLDADSVRWPKRDQESRCRTCNTRRHKVWVPVQLKLQDGGVSTIHVAAYSTRKATGPECCRGIRIADAQDGTIHFNQKDAVDLFLWLCAGEWRLLAKCANWWLDNYTKEDSFNFVRELLPVFEGTDPMDFIGKGLILKPGYTDPALIAEGRESMRDFVIKAQIHEWFLQLLSELRQAAEEQSVKALNLHFHDIMCLIDDGPFVFESNPDVDLDMIHKVVGEAATSS